MFVWSDAGATVGLRVAVGVDSGVGIGVGVGVELCSGTGGTEVVGAVTGDGGNDTTGWGADVYTGVLPDTCDECAPETCEACEVWEACEPCEKWDEPDECEECELCETWPISSAPEAALRSAYT